MSAAHWSALAACRDVGVDVMFPGVGGDGVAEAKAKVVCSGCPVQKQCLQDALERGEEWGIWGGLTETERFRIRTRGCQPIHCARCSVLMVPANKRNELRPACSQRAGKQVAGCPKKVDRRRPTATARPWLSAAIRDQLIDRWLPLHAEGVTLTVAADRLGVTLGALQYAIAVARRRGDPRVLAPAVRVAAWDTLTATVPTRSKDSTSGGRP